eukprot:m.122245 g.122245  ORF g.122245 m.122245 type:complete len:597 (+) comp14596_c2_seq1:44-1834(+)
MARFTERENELTTEIAGAEPVGIVRMLRQTDAQLFAGWRGEPCVLDPEILEKLRALEEQAYGALVEALEDKKQIRFVFSGCGTSGRIAWLCARSYNTIVAEKHPDLPPLFHHLLSGGDEAMVLSKELPEDDPHLGQRELAAIVEASAHTFFFGITCGLSAPYVAGQVAYAMDHPRASTCLIGFNPPSLARDAPVEGWDRTCRAVFTDLASRETRGRAAGPVAGTPYPAHTTVCPVAGPEPITGSSRMKGGSLTKIILDAVFAPALARALARGSGPVAPIIADGTGVEATVALLQRAARAAYRQPHALASIVSHAGHALRAAGRLVYLGRTAGLLGLIDASEMVDTYGCRMDEVRALVCGGWHTCTAADPTHEAALIALSPLLDLRPESFFAGGAAGLTPTDVVIVLSYNDLTAADLDVVKQAVASGAQVAAITVASAQQPCQLDQFSFATHLKVDMGLPEPHPRVHLLADLALKLILNSITTGANIMKGAVFGHTMINLTVSNNKLFQRSIEIVSHVTRCSPDTAHASLRAAIYGAAGDGLPLDAPLSRVIEVATPLSFVVPTACLLATARYTYAEARAALQGPVRLNALIAAALQ